MVKAPRGGGRGWLLVAPALLLLGLFFVGPLLVNFQQSLRVGPARYGLAQYGRILGDAYYLGVVGQSVLLSLAVTAATLLLGYPLAFAIARSGGALKSVLMFVVVAPLLVNVVIRSFGWMVILGRSGVVNSALAALGLPTIDIANSWLSIATALVHVLLPFMVLSIASTLEMVDPRLEDAATTLGASPRRRFLHVTLPLSLEGVIGGSLLVFALTMGSFVTVMLMGDNRTMVLALLMYQQLTVASDWPFAAALGMVLLALVLAVVWLQARLTRAFAR